MGSWGYGQKENGASHWPWLALAFGILGDLQEISGLEIPNHSVEAKGIPGDHTEMAKENRSRSPHGSSGTQSEGLRGLFSET